MREVLTDVILLQNGQMILFFFLIDFSSLWRLNVYTSELFPRRRFTHFAITMGLGLVFPKTDLTMCNVLLLF